MKTKVRTFRYARAGFLGNNRRNQARRPLITGGVAAASSGRPFSDRHSMLGRIRRMALSMSTSDRSRAG
jgi:hypothetical protein